MLFSLWQTTKEPKNKNQNTRIMSCPPSYHAYLSMIGVNAPSTSTKEDSNYANAIRKMLDMVKQAEKGNTRVILLTELYLYLETHMETMMATNPRKWAVFSASVYLKTMQLIAQYKKGAFNPLMAPFVCKLMNRCVRVGALTRHLLLIESHCHTTRHPTVRKAIEAILKLNHNASQQT